MKTRNIQRLLKVPEHSFFLFGARGTGKSTWLKQVLPNSIFLDLLDLSLQLELTTTPQNLEAMVGKNLQNHWIVLDEVQKMPELLSEVHRLIEKHRWKFALCGSSARKLKRSGADLLAGRAITLNMESFTSAELGKDFNLEHALNWGQLPVLYNHKGLEADILHAYVNTYLKEEIKEEGAVRNLGSFMRFLSVAGIMNAQQLNTQNIAREAQVPRSTVDGYFELLKDTLLGFFLPAYRPGIKVREAARPKFYWLDPGIARGCAGLLRDPIGDDWKGTALETLLFHELRSWNEIGGKYRNIAYYRSAAGLEIDFVIETRKRQPGQKPTIICIEVKHATSWQRKWEKALKSIANDDRLKVTRRIGIYRGNRRYEFDGVEVLPVEDFLKELWEGKVF